MINDLLCLSVKVKEYNIDLIFENQTYEYTIDAENLEILESEQAD